MAKIKRQKHVKKTLKFYKTHFGITPPYKILIDGTFCKEALHFQINIWEQMPKYLDSEVHLLTSNCVVRECTAFGFRHDLPLYGVCKVISQYTVIDCGHENPISPSLCFMKMVKKNAEYFIATQDRKLSDNIRGLHGVPLLYIAHKSINLEAPSTASKNLANHNEDVKLNVSQRDQEMLSNVKGSTIEKGMLKRKKKKISGPNPLSCKKKKKMQEINTSKKRHRKRKHKKMTNIT